MGSTAYEVSRAALEGRIDELSRWLSFWTALVVLGLIFEYGAEIAERVPGNWRPKTARNFRWIGLWWFIGMLFITGGVAGELTIGAMSSRAEGTLRDINNAFIARLRQDATSAEQDASRAKLDAQGAAEAAHSARREADSFERDIKLAKEQATEAEQHLADALNRAAEANTRALAAQRALDEYKAWRTISPSEQDKISEELKPFAPVAFALSVADDDESISLLLQLRSILMKAGWTQVAETRGIAMSGFAPGIPEIGAVGGSGIWIGIAPSRPEWEGIAKVLVALLKREGISAGWSARHDDARNAIHIEVAKKPIK